MVQRRSPAAIAAAQEAADAAFARELDAAERRAEVSGRSGTAAPGPQRRAAACGPSEPEPESERVEPEEVYQPRSVLVWPPAPSRAGYRYYLFLERHPGGRGIVAGCHLATARLGGSWVPPRGARWALSPRGFKTLDEATIAAVEAFGEPGPLIWQ